MSVIVPRPVSEGAQRDAVTSVARVRLCADCCCGSSTKHPDIDHAALREQLQSDLGPDRVATSTCLLACDRSNVLVVVPSRSQRLRGARPTWVGEVLTGKVVSVVGRWVADGGPGAAPVPHALHGRVFTAPTLLGRVPPVVAAPAVPRADTF